MLKIEDGSTVRPFRRDERNCYIRCLCGFSTHTWQCLEHVSILQETNKHRLNLKRIVLDQGWMLPRSTIEVVLLVQLPHSGAESALDRLPFHWWNPDDCHYHLGNLAINQGDVLRTKN